MKVLLGAMLVLWLGPVVAVHAEWRAEPIPAPGRVTAIETVGNEVRVEIGPTWYKVAADAPRLEAASAPYRTAVPAGALPDARVAIGTGKIARAWLSEPTSRYRHGVLGDAIEAGSLVIELKNGRRQTLRLGADAVFEDIEPRIVKIDGEERILVVKSYLDRGSALAVVAPDTATIVAETPPIGHSNAWLNPAGTADFKGNGATEIAIVRQPHVLGRLELWSLQNGSLHKTTEITNVSNHFIGSRVLGMSATADFDRDGSPDIAVPSLDRRTLRIIAFKPQPRDIANVPLPARVTTNIGAIRLAGKTTLVVGLEDGQVMLIRE